MEQAALSEPREITCVWCGCQFDSTLAEQREALQAHANACDKHPLREARETIRRLNRRCQAAEAKLAKYERAERAFGRTVRGGALGMMIRDRDEARAECERLRERVAELEGKE